jgi:hypothetical protein
MQTTNPKGKPGRPSKQLQGDGFDNGGEPVETLPNMTFSGGAYHGDSAVARGRAIRKGRAKLEAMRLAKIKEHEWD